MQRIYHNKLDYQKGALVVISSCLLLLVLTLLISPTFTYTAKALENGKQYAGAEGDDGIATHADSVTGAETYDSTVSISFSPSNGVVTLTPTSVDGVATAISTIASISVENSGGYSVYVGSSSSNLTGRSNSDNIVPSIATPTTLANLPVNTWGYYASVDGTVAENTMYQAIPMAMRTGSLVYSNSNTQIRKETKNLLLSFVARINNTLPADVYENEVTLSVVSSPRKVVFDNITYMQELTPSICRASEENDTRQLIDKRDGKSYWVTKLKDGNCWMSQNLDLDLSTDKPLTVANGSASEYTPEADTIANQQFGGEIDGISLADSSKAYFSWDEGRWVIKQPNDLLKNLMFTQNQGGINAFREIGYTQNVAGDNWRMSVDPDFTINDSYINNNGAIVNKTAGWSIACENAECTKGTYDAHYLVGNYYQWLAATALTVEQGQYYDASTAEKSQVPANQSICPANWQLPLSGNNNIINNDGTNGSLYNLLEQYGLSSTTINDAINQSITMKPLFYNRAGVITSEMGGQMRHLGNGIYYWSSVAVSPTFAVSFKVLDSNRTIPSYSVSRTFGFPVRCLVLVSEE